MTISSSAQSAVYKTFVKLWTKIIQRLTRIGGAGANLVAQALLARRANRAREAEAGRLRERAQPFRAAEQEALSRARGEGLTPQQARQMEIDMATARSGLSAANRATGSAASGILSGQMNRARSTARQESLAICPTTCWHC
jgi:hypothetical protein